MLRMVAPGGKKVVSKKPKKTTKETKELPPAPKAKAILVFDTGRWPLVCFTERAQEVSRRPAPSIESLRVSPYAPQPKQKWCSACEASRQ